MFRDRLFGQALDFLATGVPTRKPRLFGMVSPGNADALTTTYLEPAVPCPSPRLTD